MLKWILLVGVLTGCSSAPKENLDDSSTPAPMIHPDIDAKRVIYGPADAPVTILEYGDFQCPACAVGAQSLKVALAKFPGKVRFLYKHLPLPYHPQAKPAAQAFEVLRAKDPSKAYEFYGEVYAEAGRINSKAELEKIFKKFKLTSKSVETEFKKLNLDAQFESDKSEFIAFGFRGTPVFIVNGQIMTGAPSADEFSKVIEYVMPK